MALEKSARPLAKCLRCTRHDRISLSIRAFTTTAPSRLEIQEPQTTASEPPPPAPATTTTDVQSSKLRDPNTVSTRAAERQLIQNQRIQPIGSRRRRAAIASTGTIPFSELPYQCFQEARFFLKEDRLEKLEQIRVQRERIERLKAKSVAPQDEAHKERTLGNMRRRLEELKILADINDPVVKRRFEDGEGDMNKPIYRHLADLKWRSYRRTLLIQRITQMNVVPDVLPAIDPIVSTALSFSGKRHQHGEFVESRVSEHAPNLQVQSYEKGKKLYTIAVVNADVPNVEKDAFDYRCHFLASNIELSPTNTLVKFGKLSEESQMVLPWLPAYAQKGAPYQRMSVFVFEQPPGEASASGSSLEAPGSSPFQHLDVAAIKKAGRYTQRLGFNLRSFVDRFRLKPVGVDLFRTQFDEGTAGVMKRAGLVGWDVEFKRKRVEPLPYQRISTERYR